ncbi:hypothetical protein N7451_007064 [Penicillium sp. IBT 35674x]|nr:hypothetical protein N7451_007064 [Penicillium sp. IBT 35674x]
MWSLEPSTRLAKLPNSMACDTWTKENYVSLRIQIKIPTNIYTTAMVYGEVNEEEKFAKAFKP